MVMFKFVIVSVFDTVQNFKESFLIYTVVIRYIRVLLPMINVKLGLIIS